MLTKKQTMQLVVNRMLQCLDKIQEDGDKDALDELLVYRSKLVEMVNETNPDDSTKIVAAFVGRLQIFDIPTSLELLLILKDLLDQTEIQTGIFINDTMISTLRYLLSVNSHGVVTCTLDFMRSLVKRLPLFSYFYMKIMIDKLENISLDKLSLDCSVPAQPECSSRYCKIPETYEDFLRPYKLARKLKTDLESKK